MSKKSKKFETLLENAGVAIENALTLDEIKGKVIEYGFDENLLKKGKEIFSRAGSLYELQKELRGSQTDLNVKLRRQIKEYRKKYLTFKRLSRKELRGGENRGIRDTLGITGFTRMTLAGVLHESRQFYEALLSNEDIQKRLEKFNLTKENIEKGIVELDELNRLNEFLKKKKGESQQSRKERDDMYKELEAWFYQFRTVCKDVFADNPQQMEKLGITAFSEGYKRRKAAKKAAGNKETTGETLSPAAAETTSPAAVETVSPN